MVKCATPNCKKNAGKYVYCKECEELHTIRQIKQNEELQESTQKSE